MPSGSQVCTLHNYTTLISVRVTLDKQLSGTKLTDPPPPPTHHSLGMLVHSPSHSMVLGLLRRSVQDNSVVVPNVCQDR